MKHLVIIDGHAIAHRAYHSIPQLTLDGRPVNVVYGFYSMLLSALDILKPTHLVVCLDSPGPTFRQTEFMAYRAKRAIPEHDLISQLPLLPETLTTSNICHYAVGGFEADDLIATITRRSLRKVYKKTKKSVFQKITIITGDKDLMQLVNSRVSLFVPVRGLSETKLYQPNEVKEKLGVAPNQVVDLKALMGDMSDNYPGVAGVGPKAATDLLTKYQNLDNIYDHLDEIKDSVREKLVKDKDNAYLSQKLATLIKNIPLKFTLKSCCWTDSQIQGLSSVFSEYHFKSLISRLNQKFPPKNPTKNPGDNPNQASLF